MINYFIPFLFVSLVVFLIKKTNKKKRRRFSAPPSHQLPT